MCGDPVGSRVLRSGASFEVTEPTRLVALLLVRGTSGNTHCCPDPTSDEGGSRPTARPQHLLNGRNNELRDLSWQPRWPGFIPGERGVRPRSCPVMTFTQPLDIGHLRQRF